MYVSISPYAISTFAVVDIYGTNRFDKESSS